MADFKDQHYIPIVYQQSFVDPDSLDRPNVEPFVWRLNVKNGHIARKAPKNILSESYLYSQYDLSGESRSEALEKHLGRLENGYKVFRQKFEPAILNADLPFLNRNLTGEARHWLCTFMFWQFKRSKKFVTDIYARFEKEIRKLNISPIEEELIARYKLTQSNTIEALKFLGQNSERDIIKMLMQRRVYIMVIAQSESSLVTSDYPVYFTNPRRPAGLKYEDTEIGLPFTSKYAIGIRDVGHQVNLIPVNDRVKIRKWNLQTLRTADEFVIGPSEPQLRRLYRGLANA